MSAVAIFATRPAKQCVFRNAFGGRVDSQRDVLLDHGDCAGRAHLALLRKVALNLVKSERSHKRGIQAKRKLAAWDDTYLLKLLHAGLQGSSRLGCARPVTQGWQ